MQDVSMNKNMLDVLLPGETLFTEQNPMDEAWTDRFEDVTTRHRSSDNETESFSAETFSESLFKSFPFSLVKFLADPRVFCKTLDEISTFSCHAG